MLNHIMAGPKSRVAAVVLAAGRSSRMGAFKPLLPFGVTTVTGHVVASLRAAGLDRIHVVVGHRASDMLPVLAGLDVTGVVNPDFDRGMFSSVQRGIASLPADVDGCLLLPVDIPLVRAATHARIVRTAVEHDALIVHPHFRSVRGHPPFVSRGLFDEILHGKGESGGLRAILQAHEAAALQVAIFDRGCLCDMDWPTDHLSLCEALARRHLPDVEECEAIFDAAAVGETIRRHCRSVATVATAMAKRLAHAGEAIDIDLVRAAALVHDVAKGHPRHADIGAAMLRDFGFPEVAAVVANHMVVAFDGTHLDESAVVYLADKLVRGDRRVSLAERFAPAFNRFRDDPAALAGARQRLAQAEAILHTVESRIGRHRPMPETTTDAVVRGTE